MSLLLPRVLTRESQRPAGRVPVRERGAARKDPGGPLLPRIPL